MKFIMKHGKSEKDIQNLRQEIEVNWTHLFINYLCDKGLIILNI